MLSSPLETVRRRTQEQDDTVASGTGSIPDVIQSEHTTSITDAVDTIVEWAYLERLQARREACMSEDMELGDQHIIEIGYRLSQAE